MISLSHVSKRYPGGHQALHDVSLTIDTGELAFITGHSGAGKTTLLKLLVAIERPTVGTVIVNGQNVGALKPRAVPFLRRKFGLIFQDHKLLFDRTVFANVALPLQIAGYGAKDAARRVRAALDKVGLLKSEKDMPITLSGGEQQRLCIARAIVHRPAILLADEPTGNLDVDYAADIGELFRSFNQVGVTVVVATHDQTLLARLTPRVIALQHGATIDKFIGDAMLLFFGDPESKGVAEDAKACVLMAIAMQRRMRELEQEWRNRGLLRPFRIRMGITTGFCTVGNFGSRDRMDYTIIGNEVNLAARLQSATEPGSILLSHETNALVQGLVMTEEQPPITVKGFPKPISAYKIVGTYNDLVKDGKVVLEERDGLHVLVDLTKQDRSDVIEILQNILTQLKQPKHEAGAARRRKKGEVEL